MSREDDLYEKGKYMEWLNTRRVSPSFVGCKSFIASSRYILVQHRMLNQITINFPSIYSSLPFVLMTC